MEKFYLRGVHVEVFPKISEVYKVLFKKLYRPVWGVDASMPTSRFAPADAQKEKINKRKPSN